VSVEAGGPIRNFEVNKLPANKPIEDRDAVARLKNYEKYKCVYLPNTLQNQTSFF
jgi:hypothetical protein